MKYPASQGYVIKYNVKFYNLGREVKEVDTVVLNKEGKLIAFGETKSEKSFSAFDKANDQIGDTERILNNREYDNVIAGDGSEIDVKKISIDNIQEKFKIGPADAEFAYDYKLAEKSSEIEEIYKTFSIVK